VVFSTFFLPFTLGPGREGLGWIVINEVPDATVWDEPELRPFPQGTDRWLFAFGKYSAKAETDDVRELIVNGGR